MTLSYDGNIVRHTDVMASIAIDPMWLFLDFIEYQQCRLRYEMLQQCCHIESIVDAKQR